MKLLSCQLSGAHVFLYNEPSLPLDPGLGLFPSLNLVTSSSSQLPEVPPSQVSSFVRENSGSEDSLLHQLQLTQGTSGFSLPSPPVVFSHLH